MKKRLIIILCCLCGLLLIGGSITTIILLNNKHQDSTLPSKLDTPVVTLQNDTAMWSTNSLADKFEINIDGNLAYIEKSITSNKLEDGQTFKIRAIGDGTNYTNSDWSNTVTYTKPTSKYTIIWKNGDTILEIDENVSYGSIPSYDGPTPTRDSNDQYTYTFSGWTPQISEVTESVTYSAEFTETVKTYTVTFYSEDGLTILDKVIVKYGSNAIYSKSTPVKNASEGYTYIFDKWVTTQGGSIVDELTNVIGDRVVYASFKQFVRMVSVYIVPNNMDYGSVSISVLNNVPYGSTIIINGDTISVNGEVITAQAKTETAQYTYAFIDWTADETVGNDTIISANFSRSINQYTVTWMNGDEVLEIDENINYGATPVYNGKIPTKAADEQGNYTFSGWSPSISIVTGDIIYIAQFTTLGNKCIVTFYDDDGTTILGISVVETGATAVYPNVIPVKESTEAVTYTFEKWVSTIGGSEEAILTNITTNKSVYAKYISEARKYTVTFCDWNGIVLNEYLVAYGDAATAPGEPERDGFRFDYWDVSFDNVVADTVVTAKYIQQFTVQFVDYDNSIIDMQVVDYGENAIVPENPVRNNYRFVGWNTGYTNIVDDLMVKAEYIKQYKVTFLDYDGSVLKEEMIDSGASATCPNDPILDGYNFVGWDGEYDNVLANLTITAIYSIKKYTVQFVMPNGIVIGEVQIIEHGFSAIAPEYPEFFLEGTGHITKVYGFTKWNSPFDVITEDTIIEAVYESTYIKPIIIIEFSKEYNGSANLYIYNEKSTILNAIEFSIDFSTSIGNIYINEVIINSASPLWVEDSSGNNKNQYVINNNENIFTFAWSDANGKQFSWCSKLMTFNFSVDGVMVNEETFVVVSCSAIISDSDVENFEKITPAVVYR